MSIASMATRRTARAASEFRLDASITGLLLLRTTVMPTRKWEPEELTWTLRGGKIEDEVDEYFITGDLRISEGGWFIGASAETTIEFNNSRALQRLLNTTGTSGTTKMLGEWVNHVLWDFASSPARQLATASIGSVIEIPFLTPKPTFT